MGRECVEVLNGVHQGVSFDIRGAMTIGRNPDSVLYLEDPQVSRKHAVIEQTYNGTFLRDLGSGNGTYIGDRRILEYRLSPGDIIRVGTIELRYEAERTPETGVRFRATPDGKLEASNVAHVSQTFFQESTLNPQLDAQHRLAAVYKANQIISSERDLRKLFARVIDQIFLLIPAHNGVILLKDERTGELVTEYVKSGSGDPVISSTIINRALTKGEAVITCDAADDSQFEGGVSIIAQNIASAMCCPLMHQEEVLGVLYVDTRGTTNAFTKNDLALLWALSGPAAIAIKNARYLLKVERGYQDTLIIMANMVEARDHYTVGHIWRVTNFAMEIARALGWTEEQLKSCEMGGVLHDVGKIGVDDAVLRKPGILTPEESAKMRIHPECGARMLRDVEFLKPLIPYCLYHHERYDGQGYPYGLAGENIPIEGRLVAVADTFDAMTSNRPYRRGLPADVAIAELEKGRSTQFDPKIVDIFVQCFHEGKVSRIIQDSLMGGKSIVCPFCSTYIRIPEGATPGDDFECQVCHRGVRLVETNGALFGELLPETV